ncbi:MAG TPA: ATP-binding protein, partial [Myxococcota bacterium]|nr:ATP-binding protein [Myxococcota bacterium]
ALTYGGGGTLALELLNDGARRGLRLVFEDQGPGIADVELALRDGFTTGGGLGLGLGGARRLVNEFSIESAPGKGTRVAVVRWK